MPAVAKIIYSTAIVPHAQSAFAYGIVFNTNISHQNYKLKNAQGVDYTLWNAATGKKILAKNRPN